MIYRSNLTAPDLTPYFKLLSPAVQIMGHDVPTDPDFDPGCGFWTHDEAAILYTVAKQVGGEWLDLGARVGWTSAHVLAAGCEVIAVDQGWESRNAGLLLRAVDNINAFQVDFTENTFTTYESSVGEYFADPLHILTFDGYVVDADHDEPQPTLDALRCHGSAEPHSVILMHDFRGKPIQDGVVALMNLGWRCRIYDTPNGVALLWRDAKFVPPTHVPDPAIDWKAIRYSIRKQQQFPYERTE